MRPSDRLSKYDEVLTIETKIGKVPVYKMIEKFLYIESAEGKKIPFVMYDEQVDVYEEMCKSKLKGEPIRINILKARQLGFSTFIAAIIFVSVVFQAGQKAAIVADVAEHASNLFEKYNFFYNNLPEDIKVRLKKVKSNAKELVIEYPNGQRSSIRIMVQGDSAGRSGTYQYLHLSECAFWQDLQKTLTALLQTVSQTNLDSMIFLETTANGVNDYKLRWDNDYGGGSRYKALFYAWWECPRYVVEDKFLYDYDKPEWLQTMQNNLSLTDNQCQWIYDKYKEFNEDIDSLRQEYPSNPVEAFITSGYSVFNSELLRKRKEELIHIKPIRSGFYRYRPEFSQDGKRIDLKSIEWVDSRNGYVRIYEDEIQGHPYVVCNDNANGGEDYYATVVFDNYTGKQVAVYHRNKCDSDDAAYHMYCLAKKYNNAMITGETNTTSYLLEVCHKLGYRYIYQDQDVEDLSGRYMNKFGYKTKQNNRNYMIDLFKIAFRENPNIIMDYNTICEMESFQIVRHANGKEKAEASGGSHDDLVMACCGYYLCRGSQKAVPDSNIGERKKSISEWEYEIENRNRQRQERNVYQIWD